MPPPPPVVTVGATPWLDVLSRVHGKRAAAYMRDVPVDKLVKDILADNAALTLPCFIDVAESALRRGDDDGFCTVYVVARELENKVLVYNGRQRYRRYLWELAIEERSETMFRFLMQANLQYFTARTQAHGFTPLAKALVSCRKAADTRFVECVCQQLAPYAEQPAFMSMAMLMDKQGFTPFMHAVRQDRGDYMKILFRHFGRDTLMEPTGIHCTFRRHSPMALAVVYGAANAVATLLDNGGSPTETNFHPDGMDPLHLAVHLAFSDNAMASLDKYFLIVELFMKQGIDLSKIGLQPQLSTGGSLHLLHMCAAGRAYDRDFCGPRAARDMMRILLANGTANVNVRTGVGHFTPLLTSLRAGDYHVANELLRPKWFCTCCGEIHFSKPTECIDPTCLSYMFEDFACHYVAPAHAHVKNKSGRDVYDLFCVKERHRQFPDAYYVPNGYALSDTVALRLVGTLGRQPVCTRSFHRTITFADRAPLMRMSPWSLKTHAAIRGHDAKGFRHYRTAVRRILEAVLLVLTMVGAPGGRYLRSCKRAPGVVLPRELAVLVLEYFTEGDFLVCW